MISQNVIRKIDETIKKIWLNEIVEDYEDCNMLKEDSLKCCLYYHLRKKLEKLLKENNLRIYPEFYFKDLKYRADIAIVELDTKSEKPYLEDRVKNVVAVFELKYKNGNDENVEEVIKWDIMKIKDYIQSGSELCQYYFAVIYEKERSKLNWMEKSDIEDWANGFVTELDAGYINGEMWFEVQSYGG